LRQAGFEKTICLLFVLLITGCTPAPVESIRLGTNVWPGYEPLYLARSLGLLDEAHVKLVEFTSATSVLRAMRDHTLEAAALTLDEALLLSQDDPDIRIVLVMDESLGADALVARPEITSVSQLKGKRVAAETTALGAYMISRALEHGGLKFADIKLVSLPVNEHLAAYKRGRADAIVTFDPVRNELLHAGAHPIFDSRQIPGEIVDVLVVHADVLQKSRLRLKRLLEAWFVALQYMDEQPQEAAKRMQPRIKLPIDQLLSQYDSLKLPDLDENVELMVGEASALSIASGNMAEMMSERNLIRERPAGSLIDASLLQSLKRQQR